MAQFARPSSNITQTSFTGGYTAIDESSASDADFAYGANNTAAVLEVGLSSVEDPESSSGHTFRYRLAKTNNGTVDGGGNAVTVTVGLYQGTTLIAEDTAKTVTGTWTAYSLTLNGTQADSITNYADLRLRFTTSASGGSAANRRGGAVSWAELEAPDAPAGDDLTASSLTTGAPQVGGTLTTVTANDPVSDCRWAPETSFFDASGNLLVWGNSGDGYCSFAIGWPLAVAQGAKVVSATMQLRSQNSNASSQHCYGYINAHDADNISSFPTSSAAAEALARTAAQVYWALGPGWASSVDYVSPDFSGVVQEILDRSGWTSGNNIYIIVDEDETTSTNDIWWASDQHATSPKPLLSVTIAENLPELSEVTGDNLTATNLSAGAPALGTPTLAQTHVLSSSNVATASPVLGSPSLSQTHQLTSSSLATGAPALAAPTLGEIHNFTPANLAAGAPVLGSPDLGQTHELTGSGVVSGIPTFSGLTLGQIHSLEVSSYSTGNPVLGTPTLTSGATHELTGTNIDTGAPVLGSPAIGQSHSLTGAALTTEQPSLGAPALAQTHELVVSNLVTGAPVFGQPSLTPTHTLTSTNVTTGQPVLGAPDFGQDHQLTATSTASGIPEVGQPSIGQSHSLTGSSLVTGSPELESPSLAPTDQLTASNLTAGALVLGQPDLGQTHQLTSASYSTGAPVVGQPSLSSGMTHDLTALHLATGAPTLEIPGIGQTQVFVASAVQAGSITIELPDLGQTHRLAANLLATGSVVVGSPALFIGIIEVPLARTFVYVSRTTSKVVQSRIFKFSPNQSGKPRR